jgi:hypothetical protein
MIYAHSLPVQTNKDQKLERKTLCVEVNNPYESRRWKFLWEFAEADHVATQMLVDDLNLINAPVQLRIVPNANAK